MERTVQNVPEPWGTQMQAANTPLAIPPILSPYAPTPPIVAPLSAAPLPPPPPAHMSTAPAPPAAITVARQIYRKSGGRCRYISPQGKPCTRKVKDKRGLKDCARHWLASHMQKELADIEAGELSMKKATILTTRSKQKAAERYRVYCPYDKCNTPEKFYIREDALVRHMGRCAAAPGIQDDAKGWAKANMALNTDRPTVSPQWTNMWEAAIWRIYNA